PDEEETSGRDDGTADVERARGRKTAFLELRVGAERNLPVDLAAIQVDGRERAPWPPRGGEAFGVAQGWMPVGDIGQALSQRPFGSVVVQPDGSVAVLRPE